jgi:hypothetical protein
VFCKSEYRKNAGNVVFCPGIREENTSYMECRLNFVTGKKRLALDIWGIYFSFALDKSPLGEYS